MDTNRDSALQSQNEDNFATFLLGWSSFKIHIKTVHNSLYSHLLLPSSFSYASVIYYIISSFSVINWLIN